MKKGPCVAAALICFLTLGAACADGHAQTTSEAMNERIKTNNPAHYQFAIEKKAQILPTEDQRSFYILWYPKSYSNVEKPPLIVVLHGKGNSAFDEFYFWQAEAEKRGYGILALQHAMAESKDSPEAYYTADEIYSLTSAILQREGAPMRSTLLYGFDHGATDIYALASLDRANGHGYYAMMVANAGSVEPDSPQIKEISSHRLGSVYSGSHWLFYCAGRGTGAETSGCGAMHRSADWVQDLGGQVDLFIEDPEGNHEGFYSNPANLSKVLEAFAEVKRSINGW